MPAGKPKSLSRRHDTNEDKAARESAERMVMPKTQLTVTPPPELKGLKLAAALWREVITLQNETEAAASGSPIITGFDRKLLIIYCKLEAECNRLEKKRDEVEKSEKEVWGKIKKIKPKGEEMKTYIGLLAQYNALNARVQGWDSRLDVKRGLLHKVAMSLYLTPRSRAGVAPTGKAPADDADPMDDLLKA